MGNPARLLFAACMSARPASHRTRLGGWRLTTLAVAGAAALACPGRASAFSDSMVYTQLNGTSQYCVASATITGADQRIITCGLYGHGAGEPRLSPDGQEVAFTFGCGIGVAPTAPSGAGIRYPIDDYALDGNCFGISTGAGSPAWTPDGKQLVFSRSVPGSSSGWNIWTMTRDGSNPTALVSWAGPQSQVAVSPDGTKIAFMSQNAPSGTQLGGDYIYVVRAATGGNPVQLAAGDHPSFSPDGTKIAFVTSSQTRRGTSVNLYTVPVSGGRATQITTDGVSNSPYWTPDGSKLLYEHTQANNSGPWDVYSINPNGTGATPLITSQLGTQDVAARAPSPTVTFNDYLAGQLMPVLSFSSQEKWRPLNVAMFLSEQDPSTGAAWNQICAQSGGPCAGLSGEASLQANPSSSSYIVIHNSGGDPDTYTSPTASCLHTNVFGTTVHDCDSGPASAIYYHPAGPSPGGYTYIEYVFFYRYNQGYQDIGNHAGDFEGVTVAASRTSNTFAFAEFSEHGDWKVFLRDNLECYDNGGGPGSCGSETSPNGLHVMTFPASGSQANYPQPNSGPSTDGNTDGNAPWVRNLDSSTVGGSCPNNVPASPAETCGPALIALPPTASQGAAWTSGPQRWIDWPGRWGDTTGSLPWDSNSPTSPAAPNPPDHGPHYFAPWTGASCDSGAACPSRVSRPAMSCANWFGYSVAVLACDKSAMRAALRRGKLGHRGSIDVALPAQHRHAARAVGLAQALGRPMKPGERATVSGSIRAGTYLWVHAAKGKRLVSSLFVLRGFHGTGTVRAERGRRGYPRVVFIRGRTRQRPSMVLRRRLTPQTIEAGLSP